MKSVHNLIVSIVLLCTTASNVLSQAPSCSSFRVKREFRDLTQSEKSRYVNAVRTLHSRGTAFWDGMAEIHNVYTRDWHGNSLFLPIHRAFVQRFEDALLRVDPGVPLTYWDFTADAADPYNSEIFDYFGRGPPNEPLTSGAFTNFWLNRPRRRVLSRGWRENDGTTFTTTPVMEDMVRNFGTYSEFRLQFEYSHNFVHARISGDFGGASGERLGKWAPNDPLFWIYHTGVDYWWSRWQSVSNRQWQINGNDIDGNPVNAYTPLPGFRGKNVGDYLSNDWICARYEDPRNARWNRVSKRDDYIKLPPVPEPLDEGHARMMNITMEQNMELHENLKERYVWVEAMINRKPLSDMQ